MIIVKINGLWKNPPIFKKAPHKLLNYVVKGFVIAKYNVAHKLRF